MITGESGSGNVHIGRNVGTPPLVPELLHVNPVGSAPAVDAPTPGRPFE